MERNYAYLVLNVCDSDQWDAVGDGQRIPEARRPTVLHSNRQTAESEAVRLQKRNPGARFLVFELTNITKSIKVPTHITLGGQVFGEENHAVLCSVHDGIPF